MLEAMKKWKVSERKQNTSAKKQEILDLKIVMKEI